MTNFNKLRQIAGCVFLAVCVVLVGYRFVSPTAQAGRQFFEHLPLGDIRYVSLEPTKEDSLIRKAVVIKDRAEIAALLAPMKGMVHYSPEHPKTKWSIAIRVGTDKAEYGGVIVGTSNQGTLFTYNSGVTSGWVFQQYLLSKPPAEVLAVINDNVLLPSGATSN